MTKPLAILSCFTILAGICLTAAFVQRKAKPVKMGNLIPMENECHYL